MSSAATSASKVGVKYVPPTLGVEFSVDSSGNQRDAVLIDLSAETMASGSDRALLEAATAKRPDIINSQIVSMPQVLRLLSQLRVHVQGKNNTPAPPQRPTATSVAPPTATSATGTTPKKTSPQKPSPQKQSPQKPSPQKTIGGGKIVLAVGMEVQGKRPNWSRPYGGKITKINFNKVPKTLNIYFAEDDSEEKFFPLHYVVDYKNMVLKNPDDDEGEDGGTTIDSSKIVRAGTRLEVKKPNWSTAYWGVVKKVKSKTQLHMLFDDGTEDKFIKFPWVVNAKDWVVDDGKGSLGTSKKKAAYTAPDGKGFQKKSEWAKYMMDKFYSFHDQTGQRGSNALIKEPGSVNGQEFHIKDVKDSDVAVLCWSSTVQIDRLENCKVLVGPVESSCFVRDCVNCEFIMACRQLRTRDLKNCTFRLLAGTDPVIERSTDLTFSPFNGSYHGLRKHCTSAGLNPNDNHWRLVFDFNKNGSDGYGVPGPHHKLQDRKAEDWVFNDPKGDCGDETCENPVPADAKATTQSEGGSGFSQGDTAKKDQNAAKKPVEVDPASAALAAMPMPTGGPKDPFDWVKEADLPAMNEGCKVRVCFSREGGAIRPSHFYIGQVVRHHEKEVKGVMTKMIEVLYEDGDKETDVAIQWVQVRKKKDGVYRGEGGDASSSAKGSPVASTVGDDSGSFELEGSLGEDGYSLSFDDNDGSDDGGF
jgi:hypothetical protein